MRNFLLRLKIATLLFAFSGGSPCRGDEGKPSILDYPRIRAEMTSGQARAVFLMRSQRYVEAEATLRKIIERFPQSPSAHYNLACMHAIRGNLDESFQSLDRAVELGFRREPHIRNDPDLANLREDERFLEILKSAEKPFGAAVWPNFPKAVPALAKDGEVVLAESNVGYDPKVGLFVGLVKAGEKEGDREVAKGQGKVGDLLRKWHEEGTAAGNLGDFYDNHDGDHSNMNFKGFPQLTRIEYAEPLRKRRLHNGLQSNFVFSGITIGNSSTAITGGPNWRSQPRLALTRPNGARTLALHYLRNHLYFYPEHRDHDPGRNGRDGGGHGDVFPANVPYLVISQGSSGSDRAFMNAFAAMLTALRPETKKALARSPLLMPTLQQVFRRSNRNLGTEEEYFTGKAHPTVFDSSHLDVEKMIRRAHALRPDSLPPLAQFRVIEEDRPVPGRDFFDFRPHQRLFDTPCACARVYKSTAGSLRFILDASASRDLNGKPVTWRWEVLRGDEGRIEIEKMDANASRVRLTVPWHGRRPVYAGSKMESNRVDVGLFVGNGKHWSAPAFFSVYFPDNQKRTYHTDGRLLSIDYSLGNYVDPVLDTPRPWRDEYRYEANGTMLGWTRFHEGKGEGQEFTSEGLLVIKGEVRKTIRVRYQTQKLGNRVVLVQEPR